ncbi:MAG: hypothetical protein GY861_25565 [bacterium]|nr:hypothetical protein [bacterium]
MDPTIPKVELYKIFDRNHGGYLFVGYSETDGDHQVYTCEEKLFDPLNYHPRTSFILTPLYDGYYQIYDTLKQAFLFVGNSSENGDHKVWASSRLRWKSEEDFLNRTSWSITRIGYSQYRIQDKNIGSYLFAGNSDEGGDHTLYAVEDVKYISSPEEWFKRTIFEFR